jgi:hypothetical protein
LGGKGFSTSFRWECRKRAWAFARKKGSFHFEKVRETKKSDTAAAGAPERGSKEMVERNT